MTASSFSSVSLTPPLVSICLDRKLYSHGLISASGVFGISVLAKDQAEVARRFAGMVPDVEDRFAGESWSTAETGVPLLDSALGWLDCRVVHEHEGGDHTIFVGEVLAGHTARKSAPLAVPLPRLGTVRRRDARRRDPRRHQPGRCDDRVDVAARRDRRRRSAGPGRPADADRGGGTSMVVGDRRPGGRRSKQASTSPSGSWTRRPGCLDQAFAGVDRHRRPLLGAARSTPSRRAAPRPCWRAIVRLSAARVLEICLEDRAGAATPLAVRAPAARGRGPRPPGADPAGTARPRPAGLGQGHHRPQERCLALRHRAAGHDGAVSTEDLVWLLLEVDVNSPVDVVAVADLARPAARLRQAVPVRRAARTPARSSRMTLPLSTAADQALRR